MHLGEVQLALGRLDQAQDTLACAHAEVHALRPRWRWDVAAGLARGDTAEALHALQALIDDPSDEHLHGGAGDPWLVMLGCQQALARANDPRAHGWLARAHTSLAGRADAIPDPALRTAFLQNIPHHRAIAAAWATAMAAA